MIELSDSEKKIYANFMDQNGRFIIDESLPENIKEAFRYFNEKGINILTDSPEDHFPITDDDEDDDDEEYLDDDDFEDNYSDFDTNEFDDDHINSEENVTSEGIETLEEKKEKLNDLNDLF